MMALVTPAMKLTTTNHSIFIVFPSLFAMEKMYNGTVSVINGMAMMMNNAK